MPFTKSMRGASVNWFKPKKEAGRTGVGALVVGNLKGSDLVIVQLLESTGEVRFQLAYTAEQAKELAADFDRSAALGIQHRGATA